MVSLIKKDVIALFSSWMGWGTISSFFILMGVYVWVIDGNVLDFGFAELSVFFDLSPWFFLCLVPALSMNSFSEEMDRGSFQLLRSLPLTINQILAAKLISLVCIILITLLPSILFVYAIGALGLPANNFDSSLILGGYVSLFLLNLCFIALGILASSVSKKQPVAFLVGLVFNFLFWQGAKEIGVEWMDLSYHYSRMSMGLISTEDLVFYGGFLAVVIGITQIRLRNFI
jgi:ABC-2 type transport system permease protein